jgi:hypothetical protein
MHKVIIKKSLSPELRPLHKSAYFEKVAHFDEILKCAFLQT